MWTIFVILVKNFHLSLLFRFRLFRTHSQVSFLPLTLILFNSFFEKSKLLKSDDKLTSVQQIMIAGDTLFTWFYPFRVRLSLYTALGADLAVELPEIYNREGLI